jgi:pimeloyl-ACP methyl ester carboxylesterase
MERHVMRLPAAAISYWEAGDESATPVVLLHGLGSDADTWAEVGTALAGRYRVLALDQRGHGDSEHTGQYSFELMRDDLLGLVDALDLRRFTLVGHSMGGTVAALFAQRHPERLLGLVLEDTPPPDGSGDWPEPAKPDEELPFDWNALTALYGQLRRPDPAWWSDLARVSVPALVIGGGTTSHVPQAKLAAAVDLLPNARLVTIDAGHHVHTNRPAEFLDAVRPFLAAVRR